ncbi:amidase [Nocardiopsis lucentensis]|uniref:amidase n=1 Tax=Nocardiopsis lucentensis TaxID=53441 RepID=UPI000346F426|nr:amidase [Nocardiopsis lucentensis]
MEQQGRPPHGPFTGRSVHRLAEELRSGRVSAVELARAAAGAASESGSVLGAFTLVDRAGADAAARRADREIGHGVDRGPLHGIPVAVKDNIDVAGLLTEAGSAHLAGNRADRDAECVRRLRSAGAVVIGKTATHEFAYGPTGDRSVSGPVRNPHALDRMSGGSSGGSAAAVAAGIVPVALGTDTGGSVRIPAALCGVAGFKPAHGTVPVSGVIPLAESLEDVGVLAASAEDCRVAAGALAGASDVGGTGVRRRTRVLWLRGAPSVPIEPGVARTVRRALDPVDEVVEVDWPASAMLWDTFTAVQGAQAYDVHAERVARDPHLFDPEVLERLRSAARVPGWRYVRALRERERAREETAALLRGYDALALPTVPVTAPRIDQRRVSVGGTEARVGPMLLSLTSPWNVVGAPALSVPAGTVSGLPVGLQLVGAEGGEGLLFSLAEQVERGLA